MEIVKEKLNITAISDFFLHLLWMKRELKSVHASQL